MRAYLSFSVPLSLLSLASLTSAACSAKTDSSCSGSQCPASSDDLTGTWDLVATSPAGEPQSGTLAVSTDSLTIDLGTTQLAITAGLHPGVTWTQDAHGGAIVTDRTAATMAAGIIPLDVGGDWTFASQDDRQRCAASLSPTPWSGWCDSYVPGWPHQLPDPIPGVHYTALRTQQLASVFGDLGGVWKATDERGGQGSCVVTFQGSEFSSDCEGVAGALDGTVRLTFDGATSASGTTSHGFELSARKQ